MFSTVDRSGKCDCQGSTWWFWRDCVVMCAVCGHALSYRKMGVGGPQHLIHVSECHEDTPYVNLRCSTIDDNGTPHHYSTQKNMVWVMLTNGRRISLVDTSFQQSQSPIISANAEMWLVTEDNIVPFMTPCGAGLHQTNLLQWWSGQRAAFAKDCKALCSGLAVLCV